MSGSDSDLNQRQTTTPLKSVPPISNAYKNLRQTVDDDEDRTPSGESSYSDISSSSRLRLLYSELVRRRATAASIASEIENVAEATSPDTNDLVALMETRRKDKEREAQEQEELEETGHSNFQPGRLALVGALVILFFAHCAAAFYCFRNPEPYEHPYTCLTPNCRRMSKYLIKAMNSSVDPCEDFYMYTCGRHIAENPPSTVKSNVSLTFLDGIPFKYDGNEKLGTFLKPVSKYPVNQILPFYKSCVFQARRNERGYSPFINLLAKLKLLYPYTGGGTKPSIARYIARIYKHTGKMCFLRISDTTHNFITVGVSNTDQEILVTTPTIYARTMKNVFTMLKSELQIEDDEEIDTIIWLVMRFEAQLATIQAKGLTIQLFGFPSNMGKYIKIPKPPHKNFNDKTGIWQWQHFIDELYIRGETDKPVLFFNYILSIMSQEDRFYILVMERFLQASAFYTVFRYFQWTLMKSFAFDLTTEMQREMMHIFRWIGQTQAERCFRSVFTNLNALAAERYTLESFSDFKKTDTQMAKVTNLLTMNMMNISLGLPEGISMSIIDTFATLKVIDANIKEMSEFIPTFYRGLNVSEETYFTNVLQARSIRARNEVLRIRKVYPYKNWPLGAYSLSEITMSFLQDVNVNRRFLHVPFGALYEPFVGNDLPILDIGGYGFWIVGFYMMMYAANDLLVRHAFDRKMTEPLSDVMYQKKMEYELLPRIDCIYDSYKQLESRVFPGIKLNPLSSPSRVKNLADVLAFQVITEIAKMLEKDRNVFPEYQLLPGLEHYSPQQLLHHSIARQACTSNEPYVVKFLLENGPTPFELRINGAFRISPHFAKAWHCSKKSYMNPQTKCPFFKPLKKVKTDWDSKYVKTVATDSELVNKTERNNNKK